MKSKLREIWMFVDKNEKSSYFCRSTVLLNHTYKYKGHVRYFVGSADILAHYSSVSIPYK